MMGKLTFKAKEFDELSTRELYEIARARTEVFLMEQRIICRDLDGEDYRALHCFLEAENGTVMAYLRALTAKEAPDTVQIGRVLSLVHGKGLGKKLMLLSLTTSLTRNLQSVISSSFSCFLFYRIISGQK